MMDFVRIELEKEYEKVRKDYDKCIWDGNHILNRKAGYIDDKYELEEHYYEELNEIESNLEDVDDEIDENRIIFYELSEKIENIKKKYVNVMKKMNRNLNNPIIIHQRNKQN